MEGLVVFKLLIGFSYAAGDCINNQITHID